LNLYLFYRSQRANSQHHVVLSQIETLTRDIEESDSNLRQLEVAKKKAEETAARLRNEIKTCQKKGHVSAEDLEARINKLKVAVSRQKDEVAAAELAVDRLALEIGA
jgi:peptidoglycan hydrolase CwlO-like protein